MGQFFKNMVMAGIVSGAVYQGQSAIAQEREMDIATGLTREYNSCMAQEDTPARAAAIAQHHQATQEVETAYESENRAWQQEQARYFEEIKRVAAAHDIPLSFGVAVDTPDLGATIAFAQMKANQRRAEILLEEQTGLRPPVMPISLHERRQQLGATPQTAAQVCSARLAPRFQAAGIDVIFDLPGILNRVIEEQGPQAYDDLVAPSQP